jgi:hypothetical protein
MTPCGVGSGWNAELVEVVYREVVETSAQSVERGGLARAARSEDEKEHVANLALVRRSRVIGREVAAAAGRVARSTAE